MEQTILETLINFGPGGVLAAICYYKWQKAEDRSDKLRDAFDQKVEAYHQLALQLQKAGFDNSLRVEGVLMNATQALAANTSTVQALLANGKGLRND